jgi:hypothetical protein|nr:MAG TPA: hypothetical protein [Caudoviricetes sp.]
MEKIQLGINYSESIQFIDQTHEITLDNGYDVIFNITAEVIVSDNIGATFYDESQTTVDVQNLEVEIIEVYSGEDLIILSDSAEKELKQQILENIE